MTWTMEIEQEEFFQPIVYFEDPSYARIPDEYLRRVVRQWRYLCEREIGAYNADLTHECGEACLEPIDLKYFYPDTDNQFTRMKNELHEQYDYLKAGPIKSDLGLFGCPRSGILHWCPPTMALRQQDGGCRFLSEDHHGAIVCRYSGQVVQPSPGHSDRFTTDTVEYDRDFETENREQREAREAAGLDKHHNEAVYVSPEEKAEQQRSKVEHQGLTRLNRNLENRYQRQVQARANQSVVPSLERSPRKNQKQPPAGGAISSLAPPASAAAGVKKRKVYDAGYNLHISQETMRTIRLIISHLLTDRTAQLAVGHEGLPALDPLDVYLEVCLKRVARMYALISHEKELDRTRETKQNARHGACTSLNIKNITLTTLYTYAKGFNIESTNLIPLDDRLAQLLPQRKNLCWFGIEPTMLRYLQEQRESPQGKEKKYDASMTTAAMLQIQQTIRNFPEGLEYLKLLLNNQ